MLRFTICLLCALTFVLPEASSARSNLPVETEAVWQEYLLSSPRDQETKDFVGIRIQTFITNLQQLEQQVESLSSNSLEISETANRLRRDYQMLEATIRNLQMLSQGPDGARTADLELLSSLGNIYGQAGALLKQ